MEISIDEKRAPVRVMHLITGLGVGGAEASLAKLLSGMDREKFQNIVYSMIEPDAVGDMVRAGGTEVHSLHMRRGVPDAKSLIRLVRAIRKWRPVVLQTWMYHADLLGGIAARLAGNVPVIWNIRHSDLRAGSDKTMTIRVAQLCARLSLRLPARIVCCAESSRIIHSGMGYSPAKMVVIPNGFDLEKYHPRPDAAALCEKHFDIPPTVPLVSLIARFHPQKDHTTFLAAAKLFLRDYPDARFALCGDGIDESNSEMMSLLDSFGIRKSVLLLGRRKPEEIALIMSRSILTTSASRGEGFPNVIGEAMACGTICVVTDVGDSAYIVGDCGVVVRPGSPEELANGWKQVMSMQPLERETVGSAARQRISVNFGLSSIVTRYQDLYSEMAGVSS